MTGNPRKTLSDLMNEIIWTRKETCRVLRIDPRTLNRYLFHPDPRKRLSSLKIGNTVRLERIKVINYFKAKIGQDRTPDFLA